MEKNPAPQSAFPRLLIAGSGGSTGKTLVALGLGRFFADRGLAVQAFKKGPDYIDTAWLSLAAGRVARNLDLYFLDSPELRGVFQRAATGMDLSLIEGNRGLYDGRDNSGSCSTAEVARVVAAPIILVLNAAKMTRTAAALVSGLAGFEADVNIAGVVLNRVGAQRHSNAVIAAIERHTDIPVLGALPRLNPVPIPEGSMGLATRHGGIWERAEEIVERLARLMAEHVDCERLLEIGRSAPTMPLAAESFSPAPFVAGAERACIGYVRDHALWFYYPENLEALANAGAELVQLSLLSPEAWPELDGLYLGGGFPEHFRERIAGNTAHLAAIRGLAGLGAPIYAECGGAMLLMESIAIDGAAYAMAGLFASSSVCEAKPQGLGYVTARVVADNPFYKKGEYFKGHEFHYSRCVLRGSADLALELENHSGSATGMGQGRDGFIKGNVFACYTHIYAPAVPHWAANFVRLAQEFRQRRGVPPAPITAE